MRVAESGVQGCNDEALLRGAGVPTVKSGPLLSVSTQPLSFRRAAVVVESGITAPVPSKLLALPYPTRSWILGSGRHGVPQVSAVVLFTRATLPLLEASDR